MGETEVDAVKHRQPHPGKERWISKQKVLVGKVSAHQERKCSGDSGMSDDDVFAIAAEE